MFLARYDRSITENVNWGEVSSYLEELSPGGPLFAIMGQEKQRYIQTHVNDGGLFEMEFREGSSDKHYYTEYPCDKETMLNAFQSYFEGDNRWRTMLEWIRGTGAR